MATTTTTRSDIRTRARDYLYEASADWFTDAQLNRLINEEIRSLPAKNIYQEIVYSTTLVVNQTDYTLPTNTSEVEKIERNSNNLSPAEWTEFLGWDVFNNSLYLDFKPSSADEIRIFIRATFDVPTDDVTAVEIDDAVCEIVVWGVVVRAYKMVIGYLRQAKNWDSVSKPDYLTLNTVNSWLAEAKKDYNDLIKLYSTVSYPRDINLVS
jgi:hypothetical protein